MQMALSSFVMSSLKHEACGLRIRLKKVKPFSMVMPAVPAAGISSGAFIAIERYMAHGRHEIGKSVDKYLAWLQESDGRKSSPVEAQRRLCFLRMKFNAVLTQFDIFADVLTQRSEHEYGIWLSGLDRLAEDAITLNGEYFTKPYVATYLDRGFGAAIRRARTRLPGGGKNPVAIIRIPRERMVGSGIASSLVHEVGHQGSALLDLVNSMRGPVQQVQRRHAGNQRMAWTIWERWLSEIIADFWAVAKLGVTATQGLMGVVSLPRAFVFRMNLDDPHPFPWIRVKLSASMGRACNARSVMPRLHAARLNHPFSPFSRSMAMRTATSSAALPISFSLIPSETAVWILSLKCLFFHTVGANSSSPRSSGGIKPIVTGPEPTYRHMMRETSCSSSRTFPGYWRFCRYWQTVSSRAGGSFPFTCSLMK